MEPTQPAAGLPEDERTRVQRGTSNLGAAEPLEESRPGPVLAYVRNGANSVAAPPRSTIWLRRLGLIIFVVFCMEVGIMLAVLPWKQIWTNNPLIVAHPGLRTILANNFVRGVFSGVGIIDLWIGIWEAVHYSEG